MPTAAGDRGWRALLAGIGVEPAMIDRALAEPSAEALDLLDVIRGHSLRGSAAEAAAVAWAVERQLPALWGALADALTRHYGVPAPAVAYLRHEAARAAEVAARTDALVERYLLPADPYRVYEARRAAREAVWAWTVLTEAGAA